ncbi:hypothetical protein [Brevinema andersonii]|uniref:hypothetical protein n=1 Tax=Brevinema andersonii TaxID=34097 RepID=UPI000B8A30BF|nr:hypothetical protein [Brevinema andersonii]
MSEEAKTFISHLSKHDLYSSASLGENFKVTIDQNIGNVTFKEPNSATYGGNLAFHNTLNATKAVYEIKGCATL